MTVIHIGALAYIYQTIDVIGPFDVLGSGSKAVMEIVKAYAPITDEAMESAPTFIFHHIGLTRDHVQLTGGYVIEPTTTVEECPELDCLLLGGPDPETFELDPKFANFIRRHVADGKLLFTNCTGSFVAATAGVLDGKAATINNVEYDWVVKRFPKVHWTKETKWVVDGNIWTASGAVAGMDMISHWLQERFGQDVFMISALGLDFEPRNIHGVLDVIPKRYDGNGKQLFTHVSPSYDTT
ncbi:Fc.00g055230.m01.CDS01 [Cosmosporella sp. VM-42]